MDLFEERSSSYLGHKRELSEFLESESLDYASRIRRMLSARQSRLLVDINDIQRFSTELHRRLLTLPTHYYAPFIAALKEAVRLQAAPAELVTDNQHEVEYSIGFDGHFGERRMTPRQLQAHHLGQLVCVEGIATKCSIVRPKVVSTVHRYRNPETSEYRYMEVSYHDATSLTGFPTSSVYPTKSRDGQKLTTEFGLSQYADHQTLSIQEMPEKAPAGLLPSSVDVVLDGDLVDRCRPGDRVCIVGIYRALPSKGGAEHSGVFRSVLIANNVRPLQQGGGSLGELEITHADTASIRAVSRRADLFSLLSRSIAPSIFGHSSIKSALLLLLLGGVEKNLANGTHIRGDINLLMVGDPSTAKSQLLRFILHIAPLAINTTGRGSSGVGLTAAVTSDRETGERRLEAGAMVLADRGVVCVDEFDKMSDADRVAIHEVMEQQTVTIAKAGIHMQLNARCSVVAAANPRYSQYDKNKSPAFNVNLPDSLLSRFDLLFIVLDTPDAAMDRRVADRVLSNHRYKERKGSELFTAADDGDEEDDVHDSRQTSIFQKFDPLLHSAPVAASASAASAARSRKEQILSMRFLKKYIQYARRVEPVLSEDSAALIGSMYAELRSEQAQKANGYPITARCLETLIRLSTAHAKARLSEAVEESDVQEALRVIKSAIEGSKDGREEEKERRQAERDDRKRRDRGEDGGADDGSDDDADDDEGGARASRVHRRRSSREEDEQKQKQRHDHSEQDGPAQDEAERKGEDDDDDEQVVSPSSSRRRRRSSARAEDADEPSPSPPKRRSSGRRPAVVDSLQTTQSMAMDVEEEQEEEEAGGVEEVTEVSSSRGQQFTRLLARQFAHQSELTVRAAVQSINEQLKGERAFSKGEAEALLQQLEEQDKVMVRGGVIHRV